MLTALFVIPARVARVLLETVSRCGAREPKDRVFFGKIFLGSSVKLVSFG